MAQEIVLPQWGMEMQDATVVRWLKQEGDPVQEGEPLVELETAKIATELESIASGVVAHILVPEGATVPIRTVLAIVAAPGEQVSRPAGAAPSGTAARATAPAASSRTAAPAAPAEVAVQVTPAARHLARQHGLDLRRVQGTGPRGRILIEDVQKVLEVQSQPAAQRAQVVPIRGMRQTIATRMVQSLQTMAQVTLTTEVDVTEAMTLRAGLARQWPESGLSPLHLVIKATARALKEHPRMPCRKSTRSSWCRRFTLGWRCRLRRGSWCPRSTGPMPNIWRRSPASPTTWPPRRVRGARLMRRSAAGRSPSPIWGPMGLT